jgi:hypothetical protein
MNPVLSPFIKTGSAPGINPSMVIFSIVSGVFIKERLSDQLIAFHQVLKYLNCLYNCTFAKIIRFSREGDINDPKIFSALPNQSRLLPFDKPVSHPDRKSEY